MVSWPAPRHRRQALEHAGGAHQRDCGQQAQPTAQRRPPPIPADAKPASRVKRLARWLDNERILAAGYVVPYGERVLTP